MYNEMYNVDILAQQLCKFAKVQYLDILPQ